MNVKHKESDHKGMFYIEDEGGIVAELSYTSQENNIITLDHVEVNKKLSGQGIGSKLVKKSVEYARENELKIDPLCPFAEAEFKRHESYSDVQTPS
ncbi:MAG: GNAT family N-acetyltransferase [Salegentibacter sp.]